MHLTHLGSQDLAVHELIVHNEQRRGVGGAVRGLGLSAFRAGPFVDLRWWCPRRHAKFV